jgi:hypothetical protein
VVFGTILQQFSKLDVGIYGDVRRRNLAALAEVRQEVAEAASQWRAVLTECPGHAEATRCVNRLGG